MNIRFSKRDNILFLSLSNVTIYEKDVLFNRWFGDNLQYPCKRDAWSIFLSRITDLNV